MRDRRFAPLFWTQFLGAFNDNLFKNALVILVTFRSVSVGGLSPDQMVALSGGVFIAPYFLFSAISGQLADRYDKAVVIRATKVLEIGIMAIGAAGFALGNVPLLLLVLFLLGVQATIFGPCKYAILPQHLSEAELVGGNALIEMGTYLAILLGTLAGGILVERAGGERIVAMGVLAVAALGWIIAWWIPPAPSKSPDLPLTLDPVGPTREVIALARKKQSVFLSILGISWFWAFGAAFLSLFPSYTKDVLGGDPVLASLFLALFSVGIGVGSLLCERLSRERLELGLVPLGSFGMSLFTLDLWLVGQPWAHPAEPIGLLGFLSTLSGIRIAADLSLLALSGGFMIVPMYTLVQWRTDPTETSRVIAANNMINALYMVAGSVALAGLFALGVSTVGVFLILAMLNTAAAIYIYTVVPEFMLRFVVWTISHAIYRIRVQGHENVPIDGPVLLVCNHVSFVDWFVLAAAIKRPSRFVMHHSYYRMPVVQWLFRQARVIPIASSKEDPALLEASFEQIHRELQDEQVVCIFPEGKITSDGRISPFRPGIERIVERDPVPVVPIALNGLWGSFFSRRDGPAATRPFRRFWSRVWVTIGEPVPPDQLTAERAQERVEALWSGNTAA